MCFEGPRFRIDQMREAVDRLRLEPETPFIGLQASVTVRAGDLVLLAEPVLPLSRIEGRTPAEVWSIFDSLVDSERAKLAAR